MDGNFDVHQVALDCVCLSTLHVGLRLGDALLKIGFSQDFKKARVTKAQDCPDHTTDVQCHKCMYEERKRIIQDAYIEHNGLRISFPNKGIPGNSNTGNTMR